MSTKFNDRLRTPRENVNDLRKYDKLFIFKRFLRHQKHKTNKIDHV